MKLETNNTFLKQLLLIYARYSRGTLSGNIPASAEAPRRVGRVGTCVVKTIGIIVNIDNRVFYLVEYNIVVVLVSSYFKSNFLVQRRSFKGK